MNSTKRPNIEALSIYNQIHHKKPTQDKDNNRKHLLGLLSSFTREQEEIRSEEVDDLCCFDRMKKLIYNHQRQDNPQQDKDLISSIVIEQKISQLQSKFSRELQQKRPLSHKKAESTNFLRKSCMIEDMKKHCLDRYLGHKLSIKEQRMVQIKKSIEKEIDDKVDELIQQKKMLFTKLQEEKVCLEKEIMAKNLEIQAMKSRQMYMKQYITELEEKCEGKQENKKNIANSKNISEGFYEKFNDTFSGMSIEQVKNRLDVAVGKCLEQFDRVENKNKEKMKEQIKGYDIKCQKLQHTIHKLEDRQNQLINNLKTLKINKQISEIQINELCKAKLRLEHLEKLILSIYNEWYAERTDSEKKLMKSLGSLAENYSYDQMLRYIIDYGKKYSTNEKLNQYLFKVLRSVQKIKRVIYPNQCNQKLDALVAMEKIEKWVKIKITQHSKYLLKKRINQGEEIDCYFNQSEDE